MTINTRKLYLFIAIILLAQLGCNKEEFLDKKPSSRIIIPTNLSELRALLDNTDVFTNTPSLGEISADDYYVNFQTWQASSELENNTYIWASDLYGNLRNVNDWNFPYQQILYANIVLEQLNEITPRETEVAEWKNVKATAHFLRAYAFYNLAIHFSPIYDSSSAQTDLGIPLKLDSKINIIEGRGTVQQTYNQIFADINAAIPLLTDPVPATAKNRVSKPAAYALASRISLSCRNYTAAKLYADSTIKLYDKLTNYNNYSTTAVTPFINRYNEEIIYYSQCIDYSLIDAITNTNLIDTLLYQSYATNDLRKQLFFRTITGNNIAIKRGYSGTIFLFSGLAVDEVYLNRAEANIRLGNNNEAVADLNALLLKRWKTGTYTPIGSLSNPALLNLILTERRKELVRRGQRWIDIKRLNKTGANIVLKRILNGITYTLSPNSPLYILPIPQNETTLSNIQQNPR